ncbi:MAG: recombinase family protein [Enterobacteriaceae bacterium]|jgi:DNA invertase Pin-like site-specific DNA recombinase|nr:recombinase family protein [Enterobacteriaceae bacterium]
MIVGYARVSTNHQDTELQLISLRAAGCEIVYEEKASGRNANRPILKSVIANLAAGDELVLWKLDRMGRNTLHVLLLFQKLVEKGVYLRSITDAVDVRSASGRYNFRNILSAAQYESDLNSERTKAGLAAAKLKGHFAGRIAKLSQSDWYRAKLMLKAGISRKSIAREFNIGLSTVYKYLPVNH